MEPQIQYAQTKDGVSIAFATMGQGMPFVEMPVIPAGNVQRLASEHRGWYEHLARKRKLVRYDGRGSGLSQRDVTDFSLDSLVLDLNAVVEHLHLERFTLFAHTYSGPVAIAYAARYPEQVSHLILWNAWARTRDAASPQIRALGRLLDTDWETYTETAAHVAFGWSEAETALQAAASYRENITQEAMQAFVRSMREVDVTALLAKVESPTLVLHRRQVAWPELDLARGLASRIPGARLALLEGTSPAHDLGDVEAVLAAIDEFLGEGEQAEEPRVTLPEGTAIILFVDIADSTALTTRLGDAAYREKERALDATLRKMITDRGGTPVEGKVLGDGVMAVFTSAREAIDAALKCRAAGDQAGLPLHLGIHAGDVMQEGNNVHGGAVQLAARIANASAAGEVLVSDTLRGLARTSTNVQFEDRGERELKGIVEPERLYAVRESAGGG